MGIFFEAHRKTLNEDVQAEQKEQKRRDVLEEAATHLGPNHPIGCDSYCLCDLSHDKKLETFSVAMLKNMLKYFKIPFSSRDRKKKTSDRQPILPLPMTVTSCIKARIHERKRKKWWRQLFFKHLKRRFMTLYFLKSRIRKEHVFVKRIKKVNTRDKIKKNWHSRVASATGNFYFSDDLNFGSILPSVLN